MKHAYLIIAHQEVEILKVLLTLLDDKRNDVFLHIDKKSEALFEAMKSIKLERAGFYLLQKRIDVRWGDISQIKVELLLLKTALNQGHYSYLHLLSGVDLPIKSQDYIHDFFTRHAGFEFVGFAHKKTDDENAREKAGYIYLFTRYIKDDNKLRRFITKCIKYGYIRCQKSVHYKRHCSVRFKKGSNWFSITERFACFLLSKEKYILSMFKYTLCPDEIFIQTLLWNSSVQFPVYDKNDEFKGSVRLIDWKRGDPYTWGEQDKEILNSSDKLFARKFSWQKSRNLLPFIKNLCS